VGVLDDDLARRLQALRGLQRLLDERFRIPGTSLRFGWDPIVGLIPWAGDLLTAALACAIVVQAHHMRVPKVVQLRMLLNVGIDAMIGVVPFLGDVTDFFWKANTKNLALLERHAPVAGPPSAGDWLFVSGVLLALTAMAALPLFAMYWIIHALLGRAWF
jgi:hypothetical protein